MVIRPRLKWRWINDDALCVDARRRPVVLTGAKIRQRESASGILVPFDFDSRDGRTIEAAEDLREIVEAFVARHNLTREDLESTTVEDQLLALADLLVRSELLLAWIGEGRVA